MREKAFNTLTDLQQLGVIAVLCSLGVKYNEVIHPMTKLWDVRMLSKTRWMVLCDRGSFNVSFEPVSNTFEINSEDKVSLAMISALRKRYPSTFKQEGE